MYMSDKCDKFTRSLLLLFKRLCVDHCITEGLRSLASLPPNWCYSEVHGAGNQTFVMFGMKTWWATPSCWCRWRGRWITKTRCGSSPPFWTRNKRIVSFHAPSDGPACRQWPDMDTCKKRGNVKVKRRKLMSPEHWFFSEAPVRLFCSYDWPFPLTNSSFSSRNKILFIIAAQKQKKKSAHHFFASLYFIPQANVCHYWMSRL